MTFVEGDQVHISCEGNATNGSIAVTGPNGRAYLLKLVKPLAGYQNIMPISYQPDGRYIEILHYQTVTIEKANHEPNTPTNESGAVAARLESS